MRLLFVGTFLLLTAGACLSQSATNGASTTSNQPTFQFSPSLPGRVFNVEPLPLVTDQAPGGKAKDKIQFRFTQNPKMPAELQSPCFTMRTYMFTEGNGSAPQPKGYTTCVTADQLQMRQAAPPAKFVPQ